MSTNINQQPTKVTYQISRSDIWNKDIGLYQSNYIAEVEDIVKQKNESLNYACYLQEAIIPGKENLSKVFTNSFVFNSPKEIISGDFCWLEAEGNTVFVAVGDSTGHGVPGALMSIVCSNALTRAVKDFKLTQPGEILDKVRELVINTFTNSRADIKDGMDVSLCAINKKTLQVKWSGAHNPLLYYSNSVLNEILGDRQPIGKHEKYDPFTTHCFKLQKGDILYLFTDGLADQFGGQKGKKLMYKYFKQIMAELAPMNVDTQNGAIHKIFEGWKGNLEQVDNVLLIGIQL